MDMGLTEKIRLNFEQALNRFDFSKVWRVMNFLDWQWFDAGGVPTQDRAIVMVRGLFESALELYLTDEDCSRSVTGSGGFYVTIGGSSDDINVEIKFVLAESEWAE
jgi:hypothetical protein